jgi:hypothetical protein
MEEGGTPLIILKKYFILALCGCLFVSQKVYILHGSALTGSTFNLQLLNID